MKILLTGLKYNLIYGGKPEASQHMLTRKTERSKTSKFDERIFQKNWRFKKLSDTTVAEVIDTFRITSS